MRHSEGGTTTTGPGAFRQVFTLSHQQMTAGEQTSAALEDNVKQKGKDAKNAQVIAKTAELQNWNAGKAKFYDLAEMKMNSVLAAATYVKLTNHVKGIKAGSKTLKLPGDLSVIFGFDEKEANIRLGGGAGGPLTKRDIGVLKKEWNNWANDFYGELINAQFGMDVWELKGSTSRKTSYQILTEEVVIDQLLKGSKKFLKRITKPKKIKAKKQSTKPKYGKKRKAKQTIHQQMVVAKSGRRYKASS